jgi:hypothetical protein
MPERKRKRPLEIVNRGKCQRDEAGLTQPGLVCGLPDGVQFVLCDFLPSRDVARLACVCRAWASFGTALSVTRLLAHVTGYDDWWKVLRLAERFNVQRQQRRWKITLQNARLELHDVPNLAALQLHSARSKTVTYHWFYLRRLEPDEVRVFFRVPQKMN